ncbi:MAG TPA: large conductance mechanosensitive channel protein MscL [Actinobacteria bacterium]|nr:large conductance mechanosensitive channel protein MscL [Actinomycetota bacterium]
MLQGFKAFVLRGNVLDLAVAVVIGAAFTAIVNSLLRGLVNPLVAAILGQPNLDSVVTFTVNGADFSVGIVLTAIINFLVVAAAIYFIVVLPMNKLMTSRLLRTEETVEDASEEVVLLREIRDALKNR